jgi:hypothetical protein
MIDDNTKFGIFFMVSLVVIAGIMMMGQHIENEKEIKYQSGYANGTIAGFKDGFEKGSEYGKNWTICDYHNVVWRQYYREICNRENPKLHRYIDEHYNVLFEVDTSDTLHWTLVNR